MAKQGRHVHLVAICGVGMAPLAVMFRRTGWHVTGSDAGIFPPMSDVLAAAGITVSPGFDPARFDVVRPDLVIVGNAVTKANPEAQAVERLGIERMSFPQALGEFFLAGHKSLVVAGTHGKTTTSGMLACALEAASERPGYLIGGLIRDLGEFSRPGAGGYFVVEGDEYDSAYFDKRPKFVHYRPSAAIVTSVEFDHADIYRDLDAVRAAFRSLVALVPADGPLVGCGDHDDVRALLALAARPVTYGFGAHNDWRAADLRSVAGGARFEVMFRGRCEATVALALFGEMNVANALAVYALARELGVDERSVREGLRVYRGAARRQELIGEAAGVAIVDDFAHHPTAIEETIAAIRARFPGRRIHAVFEPRSNTSRRAVFQRRFTEALGRADSVALSAVYAKENDPLRPDEMLSTDRLVADLSARGIEAWTAPNPDAILERLAREVRAGDVVLCMSNGAFANLPRRLLGALGGTAAGAAV
jgi:UDP-N-acetylmuramate: L-alanyl-gamma-D-glutamyl-meso-diaminopimelate ligase